jgi:hypothetical protein
LPRRTKTAAVEDLADEAERGLQSIEQRDHLAPRQWTGSSGISKINTALYSAKIYDKVVYGEIEAWGKLRNLVDHGDFKSSADVGARAAGRMVEGVRDFVLKYR